MHICLFTSMLSLSGPQPSNLKKSRKIHKHLEEVQRKPTNYQSVGWVAYKKQQSGLFFSWKDSWSSMVKIYKCISDTQRVNVDQLLTILANT